MGGRGCNTCYLSVSREYVDEMKFREAYSRIFLQPIHYFLLGFQDWPYMKKKSKKVKAISGVSMLSFFVYLPAPITSQGHPVNFCLVHTAEIAALIILILNYTNTPSMSLNFCLPTQRTGLWINVHSGGQPSFS